MPYMPVHFKNNPGTTGLAFLDDTVIEIIDADISSSWFWWEVDPLLSWQADLRSWDSPAALAVPEMDVLQKQRHSVT